MDISELVDGFQSYSDEELEGALPIGKEYSVFTVLIGVEDFKRGGETHEARVERVLEDIGFDRCKPYYSGLVEISGKLCYRYIQMREAK